VTTAGDAAGPRIQKGAAYGLRIGLVLLAIGVVGTLVRLVAGTVHFPFGPGVGLLLAVAYVGTFVLGGAIVGMLWPLGRSQGGLLVIGYASTAPCSVAWAIMVEATAPRDQHLSVLATIAVIAFVTVFIGTGVAALLERRRGTL